ncbi:hypothetical protein ACVWXO_004506 [Bradyrhizobium sp. LM2.7]
MILDQDMISLQQVRLERIEQSGVLEKDAGHGGSCLVRTV